MQRILWTNLTSDEQAALLKRPALSEQANLKTATQVIIDRVRLDGDVALKDLTKMHDHVALTTFTVSHAAFDEAERTISRSAKKAIDTAAKHIAHFHEAQLPQPLRIETGPGIVCEKQARPIARVGLYVPGGTAPLISTVLMLGIPAQIAGCQQTVLCTPPHQDGSVDPHILYAAKLCGIAQVFTLGGAQAIAAMAYGTETVPKVDKVFGPGNAWVTQAKQLVSQDPQGAILDLPAGPSEVMVIADHSANPIFIAADLLSQAEHGVDSQVMLVCDDSQQVTAVKEALQAQLMTLPRRAIAQAALENSYFILVEDLEMAFRIANRYAPEHLIIALDEPQLWVSRITAAGSVFLGHYTPEAVGDYASGTNHVLPTYGYARSVSGLSVSDFMIQITFQTLTKAALKALAPTVETLAEIEQLTAHQRAVSLRLEDPA